MQGESVGGAYALNKYCSVGNEVVNKPTKKECIMKKVRITVNVRKREKEEM